MVRAAIDRAVSLFAGAVGGGPALLSGGVGLHGRLSRLERSPKGALRLTGSGRIARMALSRREAATLVEEPRPGRIAREGWAATPVAAPPVERAPLPVPARARAAAPAPVPVPAAAPAPQRATAPRAPRGPARAIPAPHLDDVASLALGGAVSALAVPYLPDPEAPVTPESIRPVELVDDCIAGLPGAWEAFVQRYAPLILAIARRSLRGRGLGPSQEDLDDVCENTFLALVKDDFALLRSYDDRYALSTFIGVVARTQAGRFSRRKRLGGSDVDVAELPCARFEDPALAVEAGDTRAQVREALQELPERDRKILQLFYFGERDYREIAAELGINVNSVGAALTRARERMKQRLEAAGGIGK